MMQPNERFKSVSEYCRYHAKMARCYQDRLDKLYSTGSVPDGSPSNPLLPRISYHMHLMFLASKKNRFPSKDEIRDSWDKSCRCWNVK